MCLRFCGGLGANGSCYFLLFSSNPCTVHSCIFLAENGFCWTRIPYKVVDRDEDGVLMHFGWLCEGNRNCT